MPTLQELMAEVLDTPSETQTKEASSKSATTEEIDKVLEGLGLGSEEVVKTASESLNETGGNNMSGSLTELLYGELLGEQTTEETVEKVANEETTEVNGLEAFGEATGHYFNAAVDAYFSKIAADLETEGAHDSAKPLAHLPAGSALGKTLGQSGKDPHVAVNHKDALKHEAIHATTKNHGAYDENLMRDAAVLERVKGQGPVGAYKQT